MNVKRKPMVFDYDCPEEVKQTFSELKHCKVFSWSGHRVTLFYKDKDCQKVISLIQRVLDKLKPTKPLIADILFTSAIFLMSINFNFNKFCFLLLLDGDLLSSEFNTLTYDN